MFSRDDVSGQQAADDEERRHTDEKEKTEKPVRGFRRPKHAVQRETVAR